VNSIGCRLISHLIISLEFSISLLGIKAIDPTDKLNGYVAHLSEPCDHLTGIFDSYYTFIGLKALLYLVHTVFLHRPFGTNYKRHSKIPGL
jgi:hypothetical protein